MNIIDLINSYAYNQWISTDHHIAPWSNEQVQNIVLSSQFKSWEKTHPKGTVDDYYQHLRQEQAYHETPQYQIEVLQDQIDNYSYIINSLSTETSNLREEVSNMNYYISNIKTISCVSLLSSFFLIIFCVFLGWKLFNNNKK